jgi:hypothetical protein
LAKPMPREAPATTATRSARGGDIGVDNAFHALTEKRRASTRLGEQR